MATGNNKVTDAQADAIAAVVVVLTVVATAIYWVSVV